MFVTIARCEFLTRVSVILIKYACLLLLRYFVHCVNLFVS